MLYERLAREYIEGVGGLIDFYNAEFAVPSHDPPEVAVAVWVLRCITNPSSKDDLELLIQEAKKRNFQPGEGKDV